VSNNWGQTIKEYLGSDPQYSFLPLRLGITPKRNIKGLTPDIPFGIELGLAHYFQWEGMAHGEEGRKT
jgi:hypothetical protein